MDTLVNNTPKSSSYSKVSAVKKLESNPVTVRTAKPKENRISFDYKSTKNQDNKNSFFSKREDK